MPGATATVLLFGPLREAFQRGELEIALPEPQPAHQVAARVLHGHALADLPMAFALNHGRCAPDALVSDGDVLALLPPLGGG